MTEITRKRISVDLPAADYQALEAVSRQAGRTISDIIRRAVPLIRACHEAQRAGKFVGVASDVSQLDREIVGIL